MSTSVCQLVTTDSGHYGLRNLFVINRIFSLCDRRIPILGGAASVYCQITFNPLSCTVIITIPTDMAKGKSSASAGTRKKHARKAAGPSEAIPKEKKPKGKDKGKTKEPRQKIYIPPVKPAPIQPDPLDTMGLARQLPPELLVVLRLFGKKDAVTKRRALEELQSGWVDESRKEGDNSPIVSTLVTMLPVWVRQIECCILSLLFKSLASSTTSLRCSSTPQSEYDFSLPAYTFHFYTSLLCETKYYSSFAKQRRPIKPNLSSEPGAWHRMISIAKSLRRRTDRGPIRLATVMPTSS